MLKIHAIPLEECDGAGSFLQTPFWGDFKAAFGWTPHAFAIEDEDSARTTMLVLERKAARLVKLAYVPWGPELPDHYTMEKRTQTLADIARALKERITGAAFIRFDLPWHSRQDGRPALDRPFRKAPANVQAPDTVIVDLTAPPDGILARMKPKWRYNIRLGGRKVSVARAGAERLDAFYNLLEETARRDRIFIHGRKYYNTLFETALARGVDTRLYLAEYEGQPVAGIVTLFRGADAVYLYGASSSAHRNLMAPYALQWQAMQDAKAAGAARYDLFGIPPNDDPAHPMAGLYLFKTGFGGEIVHRPGCYDYAFRPALASAFHIAEKARKTLMNLRH